MGVLSREEEEDYLLQMIDPYNNQRMTFSEVVHLFSSHMVPVDETNPQSTIPLLEKFVNEGNNNFEEIEREIKQRSQDERIENY